MKICPAEFVTNTPVAEVVTNSPVNNLKKGIAKVQAGDYDRTAIKSKIDSYLTDNAVSKASVPADCIVKHVANLVPHWSDVLQHRWWCSAGHAVHSVRMQKHCLMVLVLSIWQLSLIQWMTAMLFAHS